MNYFFIIYIFLLFFFFSYQLIFCANDFKSKTWLYCICAIIYSLIIYLSYDHFHKEGFELEIESQNGLQPLVDVISKVIKPQEKTNNYKIKNDFEISNQDIIDENYKEIVAADKETMYEANLDANISLDKNLASGTNEWVISPLIQKDNNNIVKQKHLYCAADYNTVTACCDQPPAKVPSEYTCGKEKPYCKGYVAFERWGACEKNEEGGENIESFSDFNLANCRSSDELYNDGEYSIIGRFNKYVIWNMHNNLQTFAKERIVIDNAGYMLLYDNIVPKMSATTFDKFNIEECIIPIITDYVKNKMPPFQNGKNNTIIFPGAKSYSNTLNGAKIINYENTPFDWNENSELTSGNVFFILIDPNY